MRLKSSNDLNSVSRLRRSSTELRILLVQDLFQRLHFVDHHAEDRGDGAFAREVSIFGQLDLPSQQIDQIFGVALVQDGEVFGDARLIREATQDRVAQRVKRSARDALATCVRQRRGTRQHAGGSATSKREQQDRLRLYANLYEPRDAIDERACFAGACAGDDQQWSFGGRDGFELCFVEFFFVVDARACPSPCVSESGALLKRPEVFCRDRDRV